MTNGHHHIYVLGGGIAGLSAAYRLSRRDDHPRVTLVEAGDRLGGKLRTERIDGFVLDSGPDSLAPGKPHAAALARELGVELVETAPGGPGAVLVKGRLRAMPEGIGGFIPRRIAPLATTRLFSPLGKVRMAVEALVPARPGDADESLETFTRRRLGGQAYQRLVEPVASGIFCGDPARLSVLATMPHLRMAEQKHGGLVRAVLAERKAAATKPSGPRPGLMSGKAGMAVITEALVEQLTAADNVEILLGTRVSALQGDGDGAYQVTLTPASGTPSQVDATAVVLAIPTVAAAQLLSTLGADEAAATLAAMSCASTVTVSLGYSAAPMPDLDRLLPAHGYLVAGPGRGPVRSVTRSSAKFPGRAPEGHELFRFAVRAEGDHPDAELVQLCRDELGRTLGIDAVPVIEHVQRWTDVMPQYAVGHLDRVAEVEQQLTAYAGVVLAGSGAHGLGIPDCVASAERAVAAISA
jgi:protoporphyrinogen/coproporphyrinogen III oxidase